MMTEAAHLAEADRILKQGGEPCTCSICRSDQNTKRAFAFAEHTQAERVRLGLPSTSIEMLAHLGGSPWLGEWVAAKPKEST